MENTDDFRKKEEDEDSEYSANFKADYEEPGESVQNKEAKPKSEDDEAKTPVVDWSKLPLEERIMGLPLRKEKFKLNEQTQELEQVANDFEENKLEFYRETKFGPTQCYIYKKKDKDNKLYFFRKEKDKDNKEVYLLHICINTKA